MQTDRIAVAVRPRAGYEAVDLGFRFARAVFWPLFPAHALVVGAISLALYFAMPGQLWLASVVVWWLKPLYDRIALAVLADALFGPVPTLLETLASVPRLITRTGLAHSLTWLRLSPLRTFTQPVLQLEGLRGSERSRRASVLIGRESGAAFGLLFACGIFELVIIAAGLQLAATFRPEGDFARFWIELAGAQAPSVTFLEALLYPLAISAIEPLFVAGGFALYVNRRIWLEGWDIELAFRKLEQRAAEESHRASRGKAIPLGVLVAALLLPLGAASQPEAEEPPTCEAPGPEGAGACIDSVLAGEEFSTLERVEIWLPKASESSADGEPGWLARLGLWLGSVAAGVLRVGAWLAIALLVGALAIAVLRSLRRSGRAGAADEAKPGEPRFARDLRPESLPADVVAAAIACFESGDARGALSLLYRGALIHLVRGMGLRIPESATEGECERLASESLPQALASDFAELSRAWVFCAYAHRALPPAEFTQLCRRWSPHLGGAA